jgi:hypothetical protein
MKRIITIGACFLAFSASSAVRLGAQVPLPVSPGVTVRIASPVYTGLATVVSSRADTLQLVVEGLGAPVNVPTATVARLERRRPATAVERAMRGAAWGAGIGGLFSLPVIAVAETGPDDPSKAGFVAFTAAGGAIWGSVIGLAIGQTRWDRVPLDGGRSDSAHRGAPVHLTLSIGF